jgi:hypothetical protein
MLTREVLPPNHRLRRAARRGVRFSSLAAFAIACSYGVFAIAVGPAVMHGYPSSKEGVARIAVRKFAYEAMPQWQVRNGLVCPPDLRALTPFMNSDDVKDPWGNPYLFFCDSGHPDPRAVVLSTGPDGEHGTDDDIRSDSVTENATGPHRGPARAIAGAITSCR